MPAPSFGRVASKAFQAAFQLARPAPGEEQPVQLASFVEQFRFRGVEILRPVVADGAAAEGDHASAAVVNRKHDPVAKLVIARPAAFAEHARPGEALEPVLVRAQRVFHPIPARRRVADAKITANLAGQAPGLEILDCRRMVFELLLVELGGLAEDLVKPCAGALRRLARVRHLQTGQVRQVLHRVPELQPFELHQEADRRAVRAAAEAVVELLRRADRE
ncbi:MAG: hypothetical protein P8008_07980 [Gammaproteobacteria bacterium]